MPADLTALLTKGTARVRATDSQEASCSFSCSSRITLIQHPIMNLKNEFNRLTGIFDQGADKMHDLTDDLRGEARVIARRAQDGLAMGKDRLTEMEQMVVSTMRQRPGFFLAIGLCFVGLIVAKVLLDQKSSRQPWKY
jgi:hypothetical protein